MQQQNLEQEVMTTAQRANAIIIMDRAGAVAAGEFAVGVNELIKKAQEHHRPVIEAAHKAHKAAIAAEKRIIDPLQAALTSVKQKILSWTMEEERRRAEALRAEEERARKQREAEALAAAIAAEQAARDQGATVEEAAAESNEVLEQELAAPLPVPFVDAPEKIEGLSVRKPTYNPVVVNSAACIRHCASNPTLTYLLKVDQVALNALARAQGKALNIPGVQLQEVRSVAVGGRKNG